MNLWDFYKELEILAHVHGWDTPLRSGYLVGGDEVQVSYDDRHQCIVID